MIVAVEPHHDDITLFAALIAQQHQAHVVTVLHGDIQGKRGLPITRQDRVRENKAAMAELGLDHEQWDFSDAAPDWDGVRRCLYELDAQLQPEMVIAPAVQEDGHEQHSFVGALCVEVFGDRVLAYLTYTHRHVRSTSANVVRGEPDQIIGKLRALACHRSQIGETSTRKWFMMGLEEYLA